MRTRIAGTALSCPSSATVGGQLGMTFTGDPELTEDTGAVGCTYRGKKNGTNVSGFVLLNISGWERSQA